MDGERGCHGNYKVLVETGCGRRRQWALETYCQSDTISERTVACFALILTLEQAIGRMKFTIESLKHAKLGKIILKLTKDTNSSECSLPSISVSGPCRNILPCLQDDRVCGWKFPTSCLMGILGQWRSYDSVSNIMCISATRDLSVGLERKWRELVNSAEPSSNAARRDDPEGEHDLEINEFQ
jgi:hypothetical protein